MEMNQKLFDDCTQQFRAEKSKYVPSRFQSPTNKKQTVEYERNV